MPTTNPLRIEGLRVRSRQPQIYQKQKGK